MVQISNKSITALNAISTILNITATEFFKNSEN